MKTGLKKAHPDVALAAVRLISLEPVRAGARYNDSSAFCELANIRPVAGKTPISVYDQDQLGSCTANAMAFIIKYLSVRNSSKPSDYSTANTQMLNPSRLYHYYNTRYEEGDIMRDPTNIDGDNGASMLGAMIAIDKYGTCPEVFSSSINLEHGFTYTGWNYNISMFASQPTPESYRFAFDPSFNGISTSSALNPYRAISQNIRYIDLVAQYQKADPNALNTSAEKTAIVTAFRSALSANNPIYLGLLLEQAFYSAGTNGGFVPMPSTSSSRFTPIGGHAIVIVGHGKYNASNPTQYYFKFANSWGASWGDHGYGYFPQEYIANVNFFGIDAFAVDLLK
jgi:hypothetical protein